jgi:hypothetical protein
MPTLKASGIEDHSSMITIVETIETTMTNNDILDALEIRTYYIAIRENNVETVKRIVDNHSGEQIFIVNDDIFLDRTEPNTDPLGGKLRSSLPVFLAAISGSMDVLDLLGSYGADLKRRDPDGNTIVHALCWAGFCCKGREESLVSVYERIVEMCGKTGDLLQMLHREDRDGLRPVELAARLGTYSLLRAILDTKGVYKTVQAYTGPFERAKYELSEYESWNDTNRYKMSPLRFLLHMRRNELGEASANFFEMPLVQSWIQRKFVSTRIPLIIMVTFHILFIVCYILEDELILGVWELDTQTCEASNRSSRFIPSWLRTLYKQTWLEQILTYIIQTYCAFSTLFDVIDFAVVRIRRQRNVNYDRPIITHGYVTSCTFFRVNHFIMVILTIVGRWLPLDISNKELDNFAMVLHLANSVMVMWSVLYFLQLMPMIGHLVMGFQATLVTLLNFVVLNAVIFLSFVKAFNMMARMYCLHFVNESIFENMYFSFKILLNIYEEVIGRNQFGRVAFIITHMVFVIVMVILMLNFLITAIAEATSDVTKHANIMRSLKRIEVSIILETRLRQAVWIFKMARFLKPKTVTFDDIYNVLEIHKL